MTSFSRYMWLVLFLSLWLAHTFLLFGNLASALVAPIMAPWYLAIPVFFSVIWVTCSPVECAVTNWENAIRRRLGWKPIKGFVGHYFVWPVRKAWRRHQRNKHALPLSTHHLNVKI